MASYWSQQHPMKKLSKTFLVYLLKNSLLSNWKNGFPPAWSCTNSPPSFTNSVTQTPDKFFISDVSRSIIQPGSCTFLLKWSINLSLWTTSVFDLPEWLQLIPFKSPASLRGWFQDRAPEGSDTLNIYHQCKEPVHLTQSSHEWHGVSSYTYWKLLHHPW